MTVPPTGCGIRPSTPIAALWDVPPTRCLGWIALCPRLRFGLVCGEALGGRTEAAADLPDGLAESFFVFDEGHSEVPLARWAKARPGADGDVALFEEFHGEIDG